MNFQTLELPASGHSPDRSSYSLEHWFQDLTYYELATQCKTGMRCAFEVRTDFGNADLVSEKVVWEVKTYAATKTLTKLSTAVAQAYRYNTLLERPFFGVSSIAIDRHTFIDYQLTKLTDAFGKKLLLYNPQTGMCFSQGMWFRLTAGTFDPHCGKRCDWIEVLMEHYLKEDDCWGQIYGTEVWQRQLNDSRSRLEPEMVEFLETATLRDWVEDTSIDEEHRLVCAKRQAERHRKDAYEDHYPTISIDF